MLPNISQFIRNSTSSLAKLSVLMVIGAALITVGGQAAHAQQTDARSFFSGTVGDWIGTCQQSTDGKSADNKYFHAAVKQTAPSTFTSTFEYYRLDTKTNKPVNIGSSTINTTIDPNGSASSKIVGKGIMLVDYKPKEQRHDLQEVLTSSGAGLQGKGSGTISVSGMPFGLGKNGKISKETSTWNLTNGVLSINQNIKATFKALFINKSFNVVASYTAKRGTDVMSLMAKELASAKCRNF